MALSSPTLLGPEGSSHSVTLWINTQRTTHPMTSQTVGYELEIYRNIPIKDINCFCTSFFASTSQCLSLYYITCKVMKCNCIIQFIRDDCVWYLLEIQREMCVSCIKWMISVTVTAQEYPIKVFIGFSCEKHTIYTSHLTSHSHSTLYYKYTIEINKLK